MTTRADTTTTPSRTHSLRKVLGLAGATAVGVLLALQSRINGTLGVRMHDGIAAAVISFGSGLVVLVVCTAVLPKARNGVRRVVAEVRSGGGLRWWQCLGGVCGGYLVISQGTAAIELGVALFTVTVVAGQVSSGLLVDRLGLGPAGPQPVTFPRALGAGLAVVAVLVAVSAKLGTAQASWLVLLPLFAGIGLAWQAAVNGRVQQTSRSSVMAATLNFGTGTLALLVVFAVEVALRGLPQSAPPEPWLYIGGFLGIFVIGGAVALVRHTGVLLLSMGMIAGQLLGALLLDLLAPVPGQTVPMSTVAGVGLTLVAVCIAALPDRAVRRPRDLGR
ncbi:DMT family transporter [Saccharopolyspora erythraea]|uniref:DMT family transporter n=1 Tax=Saccharopolyspora erythraea TaxID=1836 RepID=UPI0020119224|nr:DMT family transporter [Saccharopolyspora erythraea]